MPHQTQDTTPDDALLDEALSGAPDFYDIPEEMETGIQEQVVARERFFWLQARRIPQDTVSTTLLRRAIYAEVRCFESESRLAEMALICKAAKERVEALEKQVKELAGATGQEVNTEIDFSNVEPSK